MELLLKERINAKPRVVVAMSGGVDSSTAAAILVSQGYEVVGLTMILSDDIDNNTLLESAKTVTNDLKIQHHVCDFRAAFRNDVIDYFIQSYESGLTPNPCVVCNKKIKFGQMLEEAMKLDAKFLATGHYVRLDRQGQRIRLLKGLDSQKDQSYFLYRLHQEQLKHILFPLGEHSKAETRAMAVDYNLAVANKAESQDLCFIGKGDYRNFLQNHSDINSSTGPIKNIQGETVGIHKGLWNYTVGQRRGLGVSSSEPLYVVELDMPNNILVVATDLERGKNQIHATQVNFISGKTPSSFEATVKIRYTAKEIQAEITPLPEQSARIKLSKSLPDITPGQSVVFYNNDELIGGGLIV